MNYYPVSGDLISSAQPPRGRGIKKMIGKAKTRGRAVEVQNKSRSYSDHDATVTGCDFTLDRRHSKVDYENLVEDLVEGEEGRTIKTLTKSKIEESLDLVLGPDVNNKIQGLKTNPNEGKRWKNVNDRRRRSRSQDSFFFQNMAHQFMGQIDEFPGINTNMVQNFDPNGFETSSSSDSDESEEEEEPTMGYEGNRADNVEPLVDLDFAATNEIRRMSSTFENLRLEQLDLDRFGQVEHSLSNDYVPAEHMIAGGGSGFPDPMNFDYRF
mmetsp:Transcript_19352/g.21947  ORF Transcript_19352/g.21947 Transcript_19352/m.21947 type:complete len:268 (-) Transcript_19352:54-857(-)